MTGILNRFFYTVLSHLKKEKYIILYYWKHILIGAFVNYVHMIAHNMAYFLHIAKEPLADLGFSLTPAMSTEVQIVSEIAFFIILISCISFILSPFYHDNKSSYVSASKEAINQNTTLERIFLESAESVHTDNQDDIIEHADEDNSDLPSIPSSSSLSSLDNDTMLEWPSSISTPPPVYSFQVLARFMDVLLMAQTLRTTSFLLTVLPGPNYHCRPFSPYYDPPTDLEEVFFRNDAFFSCGDLVFSSHTTFMLLCVLTYTKYGRHFWMKVFSWIVVTFFGLLVASARKHYTIDITMAFYTVPLIYYVFDAYCPDVYPVELIKQECFVQINDDKYSQLDAPMDDHYELDEDEEDGKRMEGVNVELSIMSED